MEILRFIFSDFWTFIATIIIISVISEAIKEIIETIADVIERLFTRR